MVDKNKGNLMKTLRKNPWIITTIILAIILAIFLFTGVCNMAGSSISDKAAGELVVDFANAQTGGGVELVEINEKSGLYEVIVSYQDQDLPLYITKDGENLVQEYWNSETWKEDL